MLLTKQQNTARARLITAVVTLGLFAICAAEVAPARATPVRVAGQSGDTLHFSPFAQEHVSRWNSDSLTPPKFFCVSSYATWPGYVYVRHMYQRPAELQCTPPTPLFIQAQVCPKDQITFKTPTGATWIVVQCGAERFESYKAPGAAAPQTSDGREA